MAENLTAENYEVEVEGKILDVSLITEEEWAALRRRSVFALPDSPAASGMKASAVKPAFWKPIFDDERSVVAFFNRLASRLNTDLDGIRELFVKAAAARAATQKQLNTTDANLEQMGKTVAGKLDNDREKVVALIGVAGGGTGAAYGLMSVEQAMQLATLIEALGDGTDDEGNAIDKLKEVFAAFKSLTEENGDLGGLLAGKLDVGHATVANAHAALFAAVYNTINECANDLKAHETDTKAHADIRGALAKRISKYTGEGSVVYATSADGTTGTLPYGVGSVANSIPVRDKNGTFLISNPIYEGNPVPYKMHAELAARVATLEGGTEPDTPEEDPEDSGTVTPDPEPDPDPKPDPEPDPEPEPQPTLLAVLTDNDTYTGLKAGSRYRLGITEFLAEMYSGDDRVFAVPPAGRYDSAESDLDEDFYACVVHDPACENGWYLSLNSSSNELPLYQLPVVAGEETVGNTATVELKEGDTFYLLKEDLPDDRGENVSVCSLEGHKKYRIGAKSFVAMTAHAVTTTEPDENGMEYDVTTLYGCPPAGTYGIDHPDDGDNCVVITHIKNDDDAVIGWHVTWGETCEKDTVPLYPVTTTAGTGVYISGDIYADAVDVGGAAAYAMAHEGAVLQIVNANGSTTDIDVTALEKIDGFYYLPMEAPCSVVAKSDSFTCNGTGMEVGTVYSGDYVFIDYIW